MILKNNDYRLAEFERKQEMDYFGIPIFVVAPEDLFLSKLIWIQDWQAALQMEDIKNLLSMPGLDLYYVQRWIERLHLNTFDILKK